ncbi:ABC transporter permease [Actinosynnema pretiosum subsp. pretiosum]|uniref:Binding-protein-dependent transport systems inner membrane component n=2 Tax=Actinosynnema TaxID=40566 RepID=C6WN34_ACTMD|nr:ABC transporter permease [Actinosynnema mirum]ACU38547.1 binding-protein-dependent transport systems inner membrane component [Actinosynnema mirum DSM 43827]AXX32143.1 putative peptide ABC transporter, permease component [Actinosynnema pretiosum subsp. pretiosum]QUF03895.1 ABC transporter permease [Actinosynnema pretiosum subsp. pretiosum]
MTRYVVNRVLGMVVVLFLVCLFTYLVFFALSPDPAVQICGKNCTPERIDQIRANLGLDAPFLTQFGLFLAGLFVGRDYGSGPSLIECHAPCLGYSFQTSQLVTDMIVQRLPVTAVVAIGAAVLWLSMGVIGGLVSAVREGRFADKFITGLTLGGMSIPNYVLALALQYVFVIWLQWLPFPQAVPFLDDPVQWFLNFVLPWTVLAIGYASSYTRLTRANVLDTLGENYVRTARAKGLQPSLVWRRHALRPALTPIVTIAGMDFAGLLGGALITETVFGINGVGKLAADSITKNDQPVIMAVTLLAAFFVVVGNMVVDLLYSVIDPRVRAGATA